MFLQKEEIMKKRVLLLLTAAAAVLWSGNALADWPDGIWEFSQVRGEGDDDLKGLMESLVEGFTYYIDGYDIACGYTEDAVYATKLTLIEENADDSIYDIGTCDKYLIDMGENAEFCWIAGDTMLVRVPMDETTAAEFEEYPLYEYKQTSSDAADIPAIVFEASGTGQEAEDAEESVTEEAAAEEETEAGTEAVTEEADPYAPLYFELDTGILAYNSYEYAPAGMVQNTDVDPSRVIILNFDYTNKENQPKEFQQDFWITAYQNGKELSSSVSYNPEAAPDSVGNVYSTVLKDSTVTFGKMFLLEDSSPITIIANHNGGSEYSDPMILEIEEYEDNSFNINRIYGRWEDQNGGDVLTISSSQIKWQKGGSSSYQDDPDIWTDETTFHTRFQRLGGDLEIIDEPGQPLVMKNDKFTFVQVESWPEEELEEEAVLLERTYDCYEDCPVLPTVTSALDVRQSSKTSKKTNGVYVGDILYYYHTGADTLQAYADFLAEYGFTVEAGDNSWQVMNGDFRLATLSHDGTQMIVGINPEAINVTEMAQAAGDGAESGGTVYTDAETAKKVQQALNDHGFDCGPADGIVGQKTTDAIIAYQAANGLEADGVINDALLASLGIG